METTNETTTEKGSVIPNVKYKSSVFYLLFNDPDVLRELYSAINDVELPPDIPVRINTIDNAILIGKLNDISFELDKRLVVLIEHQSTINRNMPFRLLEFIVRLYKKIVSDEKMLQRTLVKIPKPEFIVLYNGTEPFDDYKEMRLSDAFLDTDGLLPGSDQKLSLELVVKVYNINHGRNADKVKKSEQLYGYSYFVDKTREYQNEYHDLARSLKLAVEYCIEHGIIADFMKTHGSEVIDMLLEEYTVENTIKAYYNEGRQEGRQEIARNALDKGYSLKEIHELTGLPIKEIQEMKK